MSFVMTGKLGNHPLPPTPFFSFLTLFHYLLFSSDFCDRKQVACTALTNMERIHGRQFFPFAEVVRFVDSHFVQICNGLKYCTNIFFVLYFVLSCLLVLLMSVLMNITAKKWWKMLRSAVYRCTSSESHIHASGSGTSEYSFCFFITSCYFFAFVLFSTFLNLFQVKMKIGACLTQTTSSHQQRNWALLLKRFLQPQERYIEKKQKNKSQKKKKTNIHRNTEESPV